jgi:hypothetical protein
VRSSRDRSTVLTVVGVILLVFSATILGSHYFGYGRAGRTLSSASLPPGLAPAPSSTTSPAPASSHPPATVADRPGIPVTVIVADHHVQAPVSANALNADGSLYVPPDPHDVSWSRQDAAPGTSHGTIILVSHITTEGPRARSLTWPTTEWVRSSPWYWPTAAG